MAYNSRHQPDADPLAGGSLTATEQLKTSESMLSQTRTVPEVRKKGKHLEELFKLKQDVSILQDENDELYTSLGRMATDLAQAESKVQVLTKEQESKNATIASLQQQLGQATRMLQKPADRVDELRRSPPPTSRSSSVSDEQYLRQQAEISRMTSALIDKDAQLREKDAKLAEAQILLGSSSNNAQEQIAKLSAQLQEETMQRQLAQQSLDSFKHQEQSNSTASGDIEALRKQCEFYQKNSEHLSKRLMLREAESATAPAVENYGSKDDRYRTPGEARPSRTMPGHF